MSFSINPSSPRFDEHKWVIDIRRIIEEEHEDEIKTHVSIFSVPKALLQSAPHCYIPHQISMGPYHYKAPQVHEMQRYKIIAARRVQSNLPPQQRFQNIVQEMEKLVHSIRGNYHTSLPLSNATLSWMMAIDASFLSEFLHLLSSNKPLSNASALSDLVGFEGRKLACSFILKDVLMLENQIPLFVLRKVVELQVSSLGQTDDVLLKLLVRFRDEVSPFAATEEASQSQPLLSQSSHLLHFLYNTILLHVPQQDNEGAEHSDGDNRREEANPKSQILKKVLLFIGSRLVTLLIRLPLAIASTIPIISLLKQPVEELLASCRDAKHDIQQSLSKGASTFDKPPLMEEISIPSVTELIKAGVRFSPVNGGVSKVSFDVKTATLHLPTLCLDVNTEVVMRNLVAFEAANASGPLVFTRYTELMNGIVDTENDSRLLRERGVFLNHLKSDGEAANLWNGMSKSIRLTKVHFLDKVIGDVNEFYGKRWKVKAMSLIRERCLNIIQYLFIITMTVFILLMTFYPVL